MAFKLPSLAVAVTVVVPAATGVRVTMLPSVLAVTSCRETARVRQRIIVWIPEVWCDVHATHTPSRRQRLRGNCAHGFKCLVSARCSVSGSCTASRSSVKCTALTEVTPGMICGSVHAGGIRPQARYAAFEGGARLCDVHRLDGGYTRDNVWIGPGDIGESALAARRIDAGAQPR